MLRKKTENVEDLKKSLQIVREWQQRVNLTNAGDEKKGSGISLRERKENLAEEAERLEIRIAEIISEREQQAKTVKLVDQKPMPKTTLSFFNKMTPREIIPAGSIFSLKPTKIYNES